MPQNLRIPGPERHLHVVLILNVLAAALGGWLGVKFLTTNDTAFTHGMTGALLGCVVVWGGVLVVGACHMVVSVVEHALEKRDTPTAG